MSIKLEILDREECGECPVCDSGKNQEAGIPEFANESQIIIPMRCNDCGYYYGELYNADFEARVEVDEGDYEFKQPKI